MTVRFLGVLAVLLLLLGGLGRISMRVKVVDSTGAPVANARVVGLVFEGLDNTEACFGISDDQGEIKITSHKIGRCFGSLSFRVLSPINEMGAANCSQYRVSPLTICVKPQVNELQRFYDYENAEDVWVTTSIILDAACWSIPEGKASFVELE